MFSAVSVHSCNRKASSTNTASYDDLPCNITTTVALSSSRSPRAFHAGQSFSELPLPPWRLDAARHPPWPQFPADTSVFFGVRLYVCVCVWAAAFSGVLTAQLRLTDGIISHRDRKAGYRKPGCV